MTKQHKTAAARVRDYWAWKLGHNCTRAEYILPGWSTDTFRNRVYTTRLTNRLQAATLSVSRNRAAYACSIAARSIDYTGGFQGVWDRIVQILGGIDVYLYGKNA